MRCWVLDTNVVVSGLLNPHGPSARVLDGVLDGRVRMVYDARILAEYRDVLHRPRLKLKAEDSATFLEGLRGQMLVNPTAITAIGPDPNDLIFVEAALASSDKTRLSGRNLERHAGYHAGTGCGRTGFRASRRLANSAQRATTRAYSMNAATSCRKLTGDRPKFAKSAQ
jgi:putative PIN family toxin of toxin-antitoxin system